MKQEHLSLSAEHGQDSGLDYRLNPVERATKPIRNAMRWLLDDRPGKGKYAPPPPMDTASSAIMPAESAPLSAKHQAPSEGAPLAA